MLDRRARGGRLEAIALLVGLACVATPGHASRGRGHDGRLEADRSPYDALSPAVSETIASNPSGEIDVICTYDAQRYGALMEHRYDDQFAAALDSIGAVAMTLTPEQVLEVARDPAVAYLALDSRIKPTLDVARATVGLKRGVPGLSELFGRWLDGLDGRGVTVAVLDSGIADHPDLAGRVIASVDFVTPFKQARTNKEVLDLDDILGVLPALSPLVVTPSADPFGHGTHVAGILAGNGSSSLGLYGGVAPRASLVSLRVLDENGAGQVSAVVAALEWAVAHKDQYRIRVVSMSLGHPVYEPAAKDPLVLAVERAWEAGLVVLSSAGNWGRNGHFTATSPCNSRVALCVGSETDFNTRTRTDDRVSTYSGRGPTLYDHVLKPDLVAPGIASSRRARSDRRSTRPTRTGRSDHGTSSCPARAWPRRSSPEWRR